MLFHLCILSKFSIINEDSCNGEKINESYRFQNSADKCSLTMHWEPCLFHSRYAPLCVVAGHVTAQQTLPLEGAVGLSACWQNRNKGSPFKMGHVSLPLHSHLPHWTGDVILANLLLTNAYETIPSPRMVEKQNERNLGLSNTSRSPETDPSCTTCLLWPVHKLELS